MKKAIVVGAGIGGLAAAIRLAAKGYKVCVYEANTYPGGKLSTIEKAGYRFDAGPSLFTMPELVEELFELCKVDMAPYFSFDKLDEICRYFYPDGTLIRGLADPQAFGKEIENTIGVQAHKVTKHLQRSAYIYKHTHHLFLQKSLHKVYSYLNWATFQSILRLPFLHIFTSMNTLNKRKLGHPKLVQLFNRYATYNGSSPYKAPGILNIIPHLEFNKGAFFPSGGMQSITNALFSLAKDMGVQFNFEHPVDKIMTSTNKAVGIESMGTVSKADLVVCNMDVTPAYKHLLSQVPPPNRVLNQERSSSALIFYWGINKPFNQLILHNIFFSKDYHKEFDHIFNKKSIHNDPTVYINISSKNNSTDAPANCENWFVMINVPHNTGQDWDTLIAQARKNILRKLNKALKVDISEHIVCESILDPRTIETRTRSDKGALYGTASNRRMAAFFRHSNFSSTIKDLYFVGGSVHPGGGIPLALSSAKIVDDLIN